MKSARDPMLTIGIPLHRSRPFVDVVSANIDAVQRDDVEILVSDRTGLDDALDVVARRYAGDPRVVPLRDIDGADWVDHYNALLRQGRGQYFGFMPHDDDFPSGWIDTLVGCLEADPDLMMAFGRIEVIGVDGYTPPARRAHRHPRGELGVGSEWTVHDALCALKVWSAGTAARGIFRRAPVVGRGLFLPRTRDGIDADAAWVFGIALLGRVRYVPEVVSIKRWHAQNVGWSWECRMPHRLSLARAHIALGVRHAGSPRAATIVARTVGFDFALFCAKRVWSRILRRSPRLRRLRRRRRDSTSTRRHAELGPHILE